MMFCFSPGDLSVSLSGHIHRYRVFVIYFIIGEGGSVVLMRSSDLKDCLSFLFYFIFVSLVFQSEV